MTAPLPTPPAVTDFLAARAAAAAALLVARQTARRDVASNVFHEASGHAARVCAHLVREGHPREASVYAEASLMLDTLATRAREARFGSLRLREVA